MPWIPPCKIHVLGTVDFAMDLQMLLLVPLSEEIHVDRPVDFWPWKIHLVARGIVR